MTQHVTITAKRLSARPIDLKQGGQFIEPLCELLPSMIAQQVANDSFEDEPPFNFAYIQETDKPHRLWHPSGSVHRAAYARDEAHPFHGHKSQSITIAGARCRAGISQNGFYLQQGAGYTLRLHLRGEGGGTVRAWLHGGGRTVAGPVDLGCAGPEWRPAEARLPTTETIHDAVLSLDFEGPGRLWLDRVTLIGEDAVLGLWRPDVVEALRALNPGVVRWGGTAIESLDWQAVVGPWDQRQPYTTKWGGMEGNFVGPEEMVQLCRHLGIEPLLCARWWGKTPEDAAAMVEYFNGPASSPQGRLRAGNGHPEPYGVKYWQIGNEIWPPYIYDATVREYALAMKAVDPAIKLLSSYGTDATLRRAGDVLDYLCPHHYSPDVNGSASHFAQLQRWLDESPHRDHVWLAVTEWNSTGGDSGLKRNVLQTLGNALFCGRYQNLLHRLADLVEMAVRSNWIDSFGSGCIVTGPGWLYHAPSYYAQQMYQAAAGCYPLQVQRETGSRLPESAPDLSAVLSADGKVLRIFAVCEAQQACRVTFRLDNLGTVSTAAAVVLKDHVEPLSTEGINTRDEPDRIHPVPRPVDASGREFTVEFEPCGLTRLDLGLLACDSRLS